MADRDPVLLVSGMGGSILHSKKKNSKSEIRVWVRLFLANLAFRQSLWSLYNPKTGNRLKEKKPKLFFCNRFFLFKNLTPFLYIYLCVNEGAFDLYQSKVSSANFVCDCVLQVVTFNFCDFINISFSGLSVVYENIKI